MHTETAKTLLSFLAVFCTAQAFDCGIHLNKDPKLTSTISRCINSNKTLEDLWDIAPMSSEPDSSSSEEKEAPVDGKMMQNFRSKRTIIRTQELENKTSEEDKSHSKEDVAENCIIQCILQDLDLTDDAGYPVHEKILEGLLKNATNVELRDFLQDTADECFQEMDKEDAMDSCAYSVKLVSCLAEKGKSNCSDWPVGDLPLHQ